MMIEPSTVPPATVHWFKALLRRHLPSVYLAARRVRRLRNVGLDPETMRVARLLCGGDQLRVMAGPFAGTRYIDTSGSGLLPKLAGCYEGELHDVVAEMVASSPRTIVNVGPDEGYYAVGLARLLPNAKVIAYDTDPLARQRLRKMAKLNRITDRISIRVECAHRSLRADLEPGALVVSDCEGYEKHILDPVAVPDLLQASILVEVHGFADPTISAVLRERFTPSHVMRWIEPGESRARDLPGWSPEMRRKLTYEGRLGNIVWCWMVPKGEG